MFWLSTSAIVRLRDQLRTTGQRPSVAMSAGATPDEAEMAVLKAEYGPLCEAMYLMMTADGEISTEEREVLKGALQNLSGDSLRSGLIDAMLEEAAGRAEDGREKRMSEVIEALAQDEARAEVAFVLGAAIAFADNAIADEENETLNALAEGLGIDDERATELLDAVEKDLASADPSA